MSSDFVNTLSVGNDVMALLTLTTIKGDVRLRREIDVVKVCIGQIQLL